MKRLHLGISPAMKGWDNETDGNKTYDIIWTEGLIESLPFDGVLGWLQILKNQLNPGGMLSISCIEIRQATAVFREGKMGVQEWFSKLMLNVDEKGIPQNRSMYDQETLFNLLMNAGFVGITPADMVSHPWVHKRAVFLGGFNCYRPMEGK